MATQNAIGSNSPIEVSIGGTGLSSLTDHSPLIGSGTGAISDVTVGTTGLLFIGSTGADPFFDDSATGDFTFTSSTTSQTRILTVSNTDNTGAASSAARMDITVGGANVGDPQVSFGVTGVTTWSAGIDNSDSDKFKLSLGNALGTNDTIISTTSGEVTKPKQSAFLARVSSNQAAVTGDGTNYTIICDTEIFDQNSDYNNSTGVFTAPVTGRYMFCFRAYNNAAGAGTTTLKLTLSTSNRDYINGNNFNAQSREMFDEVSNIADMDAGDTAIVKIMISGNGSPGGSLIAAFTDFGGFLVC